MFSPSQEKENEIVKFLKRSQVVTNNFLGGITTKELPLQKKETMTKTLEEKWKQKP